MSTSPTLRSSLETDSLLSRETVTATASTQEKLDWLLGLPSGATHIANYKTDDFSSIVRGVTNNRGVDLIVDFVGQSHWEKNLDSLAIDGRMVMLALLSGERDHLLAVIDADGTDHKVGFSFFFFLSSPGPIVSSVNLGPILYKRLRIQGSTLRSRSLAYQAKLISR